jgi:hypothetical protein
MALAILLKMAITPLKGSIYTVFPFNKMVLQFYYCVLQCFDICGQDDYRLTNSRCTGIARLVSTGSGRQVAVVRDRDIKIGDSACGQQNEHPHESPEVTGSCGYRVYKSL